MSLEIERRFLVVTDAWRAHAGPPSRIVQGYIAHSGNSVVRVRLIGDSAFLTVKGPRDGAVRAEFEYPIPVADAQAMLGELCAGPLVEKDRYRLRGGPWVVDVYRGGAEGLAIAEIELARSGQAVSPPDWVGREVTGEPRYSNYEIAARAARRPAEAAAMERPAAGLAL